MPAPASTSRPRTHALVATVVAAVLGCAPADEPAARAHPSALVLVSIDDLGAGHVGAYGYPRDTTPFLDRFAAGGVLFENAFAQATWTLPSHASMLSSRVVDAHGVNDTESRFPAGPALLPEVLRDAGWHTAAFTSCVFVSELYGLDRGFDLMVTEELPCQDLAPRVLEHLASLDDDRPLFLFLHFYDVHQPFDEPNPYGDDFSAGLPEADLDAAHRLMELTGRPAADVTEAELAWLDRAFPDDGFRAAVEAAAAQGLVLGDEVGKHVYTWLADQGPEALAARRGRYDNGVANMDRRLAELFDALAAFPWADDAVVVVTSDHGESFNEPAGIIGHGGPPYREQARVPLLVRGPGVAKGRRVPGLVASIDIAPTLLELAGVAAPEEFQGRSFAAALRDGAVEQRPVVSGSTEDGLAAVRMDDWMLLLTRSGRRWRLFERGGPRVDLARENTPVVHRMRDWLLAQRDRNAELTADVAPESVQLDEATRATLRELGYLR